MGQLIDTFQVSASRHPDALGKSQMDVLTEYNPTLAALTKTVKADLDDRDIQLDLAEGPINGGSTCSAIFRAVNIPNAVVRIGMLDNPPDSALVLKPAARLKYEAEGRTLGGVQERYEYQVHVLPFAPDCGEVTEEDILNSLRVLKAEGFNRHIVDLTPGLFVFLPDGKGDVLRYPAGSADAAMRGKPIAFIRDINAVQAERKDVRQMRTMTATPTFVSLLQSLRKLPPAPADCVEACHQQDAIAKKLHHACLARGARIAPAAEIIAPQLAA